MISPDATPIAHHPPRRPIDLRPTYPHVQKEHWEEQIEEMAYQAQLSRGERLWAIVVEFAQGRGGSVPAAQLPQAVIGHGTYSAEYDGIVIWRPEPLTVLPAECFAMVADWTAVEVGSFELEETNNDQG